MKTVYLDNNATTAVAPEVCAAMEPYFAAEFFNPSSAYDRAAPAAQAIKRARDRVGRFLGGVDPSEVLFTSCATESLNTALYGAVRANPTRRHVITTAVEHPAVAEAAVAAVVRAGDAQRVVGRAADRHRVLGAESVAAGRHIVVDQISVESPPADVLLDKLVGAGNWSVDVTVPAKVLTVETDSVAAEEIIGALNGFGYQAEKID